MPPLCQGHEGSTHLLMQVFTGQLFPSPCQSAGNSPVAPKHLCRPRRHLLAAQIHRLGWWRLRLRRTPDHSAAIWRRQLAHPHVVPHSELLPQAQSSSIQARGHQDGILLRALQEGRQG